MKLSKKLISLLLAVLMVSSCCAAAFSVSAAETDEKPFTVTKISNPDRGEREVDGLIEGGDRENSYTWRLAMRGDEIYIATTRNIASALVNMYGGEFAKAGIDIDTFWAMIDVVANGDIPRNDANEGANIISYNRQSGEFKVIYTADTGDYFRMAVTFGDDVYFGSYSAVPTNPQYILKLDTEGNFTKVFQTMGSVSLRANCEYDGHLFFAGADDRTPVYDGTTAPVAKMAVLRKSNEDDTVWERVADYRDFGTTAYDPIHTSWAGAPIWELANHDGYIYATAPTHAGFVIYKGRPAQDGEQANEYGWIWTEVAGTTNGINNPGLSDIEGGEPGTMRSLIGSVYEYNGELYAYNFDHSFGGEASAFAGALQQLAGKDVKASEYLFYLYDSLHNPQKVWKLNDETGKFEELEEFTKLMEGTTNEYVWRLGEHEGDLYIATMDAGIFYNYLTQLTNGSFFSMSKEEIVQKIGYINNLLSIIAKSKGSEALDKLKEKLEELKALLEAGKDTDAAFNGSMLDLLEEYGGMDEAVAEITDLVMQARHEVIMNFVKSVIGNMLEDDKDIAATGIDEIPEEGDDADTGIDLSIFKDLLTEEELKELEEMLNNPDPTFSIEIDTAELEQMIETYVNKFIDEYKDEIDKLVDAGELLKATANAYKQILDIYKNQAVEELKAMADEGIEKLNGKYEELKLEFMAAMMKLQELEEQLKEIVENIDWEGLSMYLYINNAVVNDDWGFDLYRTNDGENFQCITKDGFGDKYNYGCPSFLSTEEGLYIGTCNPFYGGQLYLLSNDSPAPEGYIVSGNVTSFLDAEGVVTAELVSKTDETLVKSSESADDYAFYDVPAGEYTLSVSKKDHVTREYDVTVVDADVTMDVKIHPVGDINGDGKITTIDAGRANASARQTAELEGYELKCADINGDGKVSTMEAGRINAHAKGTSFLWVVE